MNKVNVFRVDNPMFRVFNMNIGLGPYHFFNTCSHPYTNTQWCAHTAKHEPAANIYQKHKIDARKIMFVPTLPNEARPGPFEDMVMREEFLSKVGKSKAANGKNVVYCFDSLDQYFKWFHDPAERLFLACNGFVLSQYIVKADLFIRGKSQCAFFAEGFEYVKTRLNLFGHTPILPVYTPPRVIKSTINTTATKL